MTKVKVGVLPISNVAPLYLGMKKGFFKAEGLEVEPSIGQSGNELVTGMVSGSTDFAFLGYVPLMSARAQGLPVKVVANADNGAETADKEWTLLLSKKGSPIKKPADLAGKTIAVNALKGVGEVEIKAALDKRGVDPNSIKLLEVPFPEMPAALEKGRVDVIWAPEPFLTSVLGEGGQDVEAPLTTLGKKFPNGTYATTEKEIAQNKDVVEAFARAINKSSGLRDLAPRRGAGDDPDVHEDPAGGREEDPPAAVAADHRPHEAADAARLRGQVQGDREAAEARRRDLGGGQVAVIAPLAAVAVLLVLWELVVQVGIVAESNIPPASAALSELVSQFGDGAFWSAVGSTLEGWAAGSASRSRSGSRWGC